jgi:hypothetical protein
MYSIENNFFPSPNNDWYDKPQEGEEYNNIINEEIKYTNYWDDKVEEGKEYDITEYNIIDEHISLISNTCPDSEITKLSFQDDNSDIEKKDIIKYNKRYKHKEKY